MHVDDAMRYENLLLLDMCVCVCVCSMLHSCFHLLLYRVLQEELSFR